MIPPPPPPPLRNFINSSISLLESNRVQIQIINFFFQYDFELAEMQMNVVKIMTHPQVIHCKLSLCEELPMFLHMDRARLHKETEKVVPIAPFKLCEV